MERVGIGKMPTLFLYDIIVHLCFMLRIGFDAKRAFCNTTGLGNYSRSVITSLAQHYPDYKYILYTTKAPKNERTAGLWNPVFSRVTPPMPFLKSLWRSRLILSRLVKDKLDIYHGLSHELPVGIHKTGIKTVVTIHDLIFLRYPGYYKAIDRKIYERKIKYACRHADLVIAVSEQTKRDLISFFSVPPGKIEVVYQACDPVFQQRKDQQGLRSVKEKYQLPDRYLLSVGTIEERKNLLLTVKALLHTPLDIPLVVIGKVTSYALEVKQFIKENGLESRILFPERVAFEDLPAIYQQASIFIYPSRFEGFGIPILEALYSGVPVIAATGSCLEEAGGPGSRYVDPDDVTGMSTAINNILSDKLLQTEMIKSGLSFAARFSEQDHAAQLIRHYSDL